MNFEMIQPYILAALLVAFFVWKKTKYKKVRAEIPKLLDAGAVVLDVRSESEFSMGSRKGSINIPLHQLNQKIKKLDVTRPVIVCCASGSRSAMAAGILKRKGFAHVVNAGPWQNTL